MNPADSGDQEQGLQAIGNSLFLSLIVFLFCLLGPSSRAQTYVLLVHGWSSAWVVVVRVCCILGETIWKSRNLYLETPWA